VTCVDLCQQRVVICCVLAVAVIPQDDQLHFFQIVHGKHGHSTPVDYIMQGGFVCTGVEFSLWCLEFLPNAFRIFMTGFENVMISTDQNHTQVQCVKVHINMEHKVFRAARYTNRRPSLPILHRWVGPDVVEYDRHIYKHSTYTHYSSTYLML